MNANRHGLCSRNVVLSTESSAGWEQLLQSYVDKFQPADDVEMHLVHQMVAARWRQERAWTIESATYESELESQETLHPQRLEDSPSLRVSLAFQGGSPRAKSLASTLPRYEASFSSQFHRSLKTLLQLRTLRVAGPLSVRPNEPNPETEH